MKTRLKIFVFAFFVLILTVITFYNHSKADILLRESIHKDDFIVRIHVILLSRRGRDGDNDKGAGLGIFLDKSLQREEQDIVYEKVEYIISTDFHYKINKSWKDDTNE